MMFVFLTNTYCPKMELKHKCAFKKNHMMYLIFGTIDLVILVMEIS